ncbi:amidohydrolase family protein [Acetobacter sacchari]|uniref:Amidohydrolase family protein n=1 Tax=Acetobacter sacchari TaxID=2661687 RepID=A0ABS3LWT3_9PROT|nr:amidohydrolase family protein [Acetobacter sacchari]MBO1360355.1 amidohydrolase family protein [Acetobacter sacchari]
MKSLTFRAVCLTSLSLLAAGCAHEEATSSNQTFFEHVSVIDGSGAAAQPNMTVIMQDGKIVSVTPDASATPPAGATIVDLTGKTMIPGLVSDHVHVGLYEGTDVGSKHFTRDVILRQLQQYERYGVTTVVALGVTRSPLFDDLRREQHAEQNPGADLFGVDQGIGVPGGAPPAAMMHVDDEQVLRPATPEAARAAVDKMASEGTDLVKIWVDTFTNGVAGKAPMPVMSPDVVKAVITRSHEHDLRVAAHIHDLHYAKEMVADHADILAHGVRDTAVDATLINAMKSGGVWYIPTISLDESIYFYADNPDILSDPELTQGLSAELRNRFADAGWRKKTLADPQTAAARKAVVMNEHNLFTLYAAGVNIGFGTDSGATPLRIPGYAEHRELRLLVQAGLTPVQALTLATGQAAALMHLSDRGVLATGKRADFVILDADPSNDIGAVDRISQVWRGGRQVSLTQ